MEHAESMYWLADALVPLTNRFGDELALWRDENLVHWSYDGHAAIVELCPGGALEATFVERPSTDQVTGSPAVAVYRGQSPYRLSPEGCSHMVSDMIAFFSGTREPRFTFVSAYATE